MKITLFGCGSWGSRIARRLAKDWPRDGLVVIDEDRNRARALGDELDCAWSNNPFGYLATIGTQTSSVEPGAVVIATPPARRLTLVRAALNGYGLTPSLLRIEKPLADTAADAHAIIAACAEAGTRLSVGFTLLHHPLYEAAFAYAAPLGGVLEVRGMRVGRPPAHAADPLSDIGIHTASIAAFLNAPCTRLIAAHIPGADARHTVLVTPGGEVVIDETNLCVTTPDGDIRVTSDHDALGRDLAAWMSGTHRGTPAVALRAQRLISSQEERACVA